MPMGWSGIPSQTMREKIEGILNKTPKDSDNIRFNLFPKDNMTAEDAVFLGESLKDRPLTSLEVSCQTLNGTGLETFAPYLADMKKLTRLDLNGNDGIGAGMGTLARVLPHTKIRDLNLTGNGLYASSVTGLAAALGVTEIRTLDLGRNDLADEGATVLAKGLERSKVESLTLFRNGISDKGCEALAAVLPSGRIKDLSLSSNTITSKGMEALAAALPDSQVEKLAIGNNEIGNEGAKALAKALPDTKIKELDLFDCGITDEGAKHLLIALQKPTCRVSKININAPQIFKCGELDTARLISEELKTLILKAVENNRQREENLEKAKQDAVKQDVAEDLKAAAAQTQSAAEAVENGTLIKAAYAGCLPEVVASLTAKGKTPPAEAFLKPDENGCTPLSLVCEQKKLAELLTPDHFKNAQDVQKLWNAVPPSDKDQMDGKDGRPSFQKVKSTIMANAVRTAMQAKKMQRH